MEPTVKELDSLFWDATELLGAEGALMVAETPSAQRRLLDFEQI